MNFLKNPKEIGSITPSSKYLTNEIIRNIDFKNSKNFVELGPGLGTFTKEILKKASPDSNIMCFEVNREFCAHLNKTYADRRLTIINAGAEKMRENIDKIGMKNADCIVSGLPFRNFSLAKKKKILSEVKNCMDKGERFILFQYTNSLEKMLGSYFSSVNRASVTLNIPPCFVYVCRK